MVTRRWAATLMQVGMSLSYVRESCQRTTRAPNQQVPVKGNNFVLPMLQQAHQIISYISTNNPNLIASAQEMGNWVASLDRKYGERIIIFGAPYHLDLIDAGNLAKDSERWMTTILNEYLQSGTVTITEETIEKLLSPQFLNKLDALTRDDLTDGAGCILHLIPTPGAMILLRVAENAARIYLAKHSGKPLKIGTMGDILDELEKTQGVKKSMLGYLEYLKSKRNEAQHPDKRFTQLEAEKIFVQVMDLLDEVVGLKELAAN